MQVKYGEKNLGKCGKKTSCFLKREKQVITRTNTTTRQTKDESPLGVMFEDKRSPHKRTEKVDHDNKLAGMRSKTPLDRKKKHTKLVFQHLFLNQNLLLPTLQLACSRYTLSSTSMGLQFHSCQGLKLSHSKSPSHSKSTSDRKTWEKRKTTQ